MLEINNAKGIPVTITGVYNMYEYKKAPLAFIQLLFLSQKQQLELLSKLDILYGETDQDTTEWALEYQVIARMMLHKQWFPVNPHHLALDECLADLRNIVGAGNYGLIREALDIPKDKLEQKCFQCFID